MLCVEVCRCSVLMTMLLLFFVLVAVGVAVVCCLVIAVGCLLLVLWLDFALWLIVVVGRCRFLLCVVVLSCCC